jgi:hypothetical protein
VKKGWSHSRGLILPILKLKKSKDAYMTSLGLEVLKLLIAFLEAFLELAPYKKD